MNPTTTAGADSLPSTFSILIIYGPLGILALISLWVNWRQYRDGRDDRKAHDETVTKLRKEHDDTITKLRSEHDDDRQKWLEQRDKLEERYITKTETQLDKYNELAKALKDVVASSMRRYRRSSDDHGSSDGT